MNQLKLLIHTARKPWIMAWIVISAMIISLAGLLFWEYRSLNFHTQKIRLLQDQYAEYVEVMKKVLRKKKIDDPLAYDQESDESEEDDIEVDSFMVINRGPTYLKSSMLNYLKEQNLEALADRIPLHELQNYTDQVLTQEKSVIKSQPRSRRKRSRGSSVRRSNQAASWAVCKRPSVTGIEFSWPIASNKFWLSSFFGPRKKPNGQWGFHKGLDMAAQRGTPVLASLEGLIEQAGYASGYGNTIVVAHDGVYKTRYAHLDSIFVKRGQKVIRGQRIGAVGDTGFTRKRGKDASHLHFELYEYGKQVNPLSLLPAKPR